MPKAVTIPNDLLIAKKLVYDTLGYKYQQPIIENESTGYGACSFFIDELSVIFRVAKTTPTKIGQFVTLWKRIDKGPTQPFDIADNFDLFIISARKGDNLGQFIFPKSVLLEHDIISMNNKGGKRGIRIYPPWDEANNSQAKKTQQWQLKYFMDISADYPVDISRAKLLLS